MRQPRFSTFARMTSGKWYLPGGPELAESHTATRERLREIHALGNLDLERTGELLGEVLGAGSAVPEWWSPLHIEYGRNTTFGPGCFVNVGMTILDSAPVTVGARTLFGPNCSLVTVSHPVHDVEMRRAGWERAQPITIGEDCWFGAGVTVLPGVEIGDRCVLASGALITKDVPADSLVMGAPGKVVRDLADPLDEELEREQLDV